MYIFGSEKIVRPASGRNREMKFTLSQKINVGMGLALLILSVMGWASYRSLNRLIETSDARHHAHLVLENVQELLSLLKDAETGQRGYLLTGEEGYLQPFNSALAAVDEKMNELAILTESDPEQTQHLDTLKALKESKFAELKETITLRRNKGFEAAVAVVRTACGKKIMDEIRNVTGEMEKKAIQVVEQKKQER